MPRETLREAYYRVRDESAALKAISGHFEGLTWYRERRALCRAANGWRLKVYHVEGDIEVCVIKPDGMSETFC